MHMAWFYSRSILLLGLWLAVLIDVACASKKKNYSAAPYDVPMREFDPELKPLLDSYVRDSAAAGIPVKPSILKELRQLVWSDQLAPTSIVSNSLLGRCQRLNENHPDPNRRFRIVQIARPDAKMMVGKIKIDATSLKVMVYHELGHCLHDYKAHLAESVDAIMSTKLAKSRYVRLELLIQEHFDLMRNF